MMHKVTIKIEGIMQLPEINNFDGDHAAEILAELAQPFVKKQRTGGGPQDGATPVDENVNNVDAKTSGVFTSKMGVNADNGSKAPPEIALTKREQIKLSDGSIYDGAHVNRVPHGKGKLMRPEGSIYDGEWVIGMFHGKGKEIRPDGTIAYDGEWRNNMFHGKGKMMRSDGTISFEGELRNGMLDGKGTAMRSDGTISFDGEWRNGMLHGMVKEIRPDGTIASESEWSNGMLHGKMKEIRPDGTIIISVWENNKKI